MLPLTISHRQPLSAAAPVRPARREGAPGRGAPAAVGTGDGFVTVHASTRRNTRMRATRALAVVLGLTVGLGLTACAGSRTGDSAGSTAAATSAASSAAATSAATSAAATTKSGASSSGAATGGAAAELPKGNGELVGVTMPTKQSERWVDDGNNVKQQLEAAGYTGDLQYAENDIPTQANQIENQIT